MKLFIAAVFLVSGAFTFGQTPAESSTALIISTNIGSSAKLEGNKESFTEIEKLPVLTHSYELKKTKALQLKWRVEHVTNEDIEIAVLVAINALSSSYLLKNSDIAAKSETLSVELLKVKNKAVEHLHPYRNEIGVYLAHELINNEILRREASLKVTELKVMYVALSLHTANQLLRAAVADDQAINDLIAAYEKETKAGLENLLQEVQKDSDLKSFSERIKKILNK